MRPPKRLMYGWPWRRLPTGERVPIAPWIIRYTYHHFWIFAFRHVPADWLWATGWRRRIWSATAAAFGWWAYSHRS